MSTVLSDKVGFWPPLEAKGALTLKLSNPLLLKLRIPPRAATPPPVSPVPALTVNEGSANMSLLTPPLAMEIVPAPVMGPPVNPTPVLICVTVPPPPVTVAGTHIEPLNCRT